MSINWENVKHVLVVRLRSIGDTVLATPSLLALRRHLPEARIDVLLEDWVAPVLDGFGAVDNVIRVSKKSKDRIRLARLLRRTQYDVAFNLHGGTTSTFLVRASGAKHRVGFSNYQYGFLYNHRLSSASDFWEQKKTHSAEQQLALLGFTGVPVKDKPKTHLDVTEDALTSIEKRIKSEIRNPKSKIAMLHPAAAFATKQWAAENFARVAGFLSEKGFQVMAVAAKRERPVLDELERSARTEVLAFDDLTLPEITALASRAAVFVGNDSGIAHIAGAVGTPSVVIFGSSNRDHWRPWTDAPHQIVYEEFACQPCPGYTCAEFGEPRCILSVRVEKVIEATERLLPTSV
ncbi:MAG: glycosyltransferase family 9 protein [Pyrinomonadaceae bacterium]